MVTPPPLNIVYLHSHDTGRYIQPYGYAVPTPNLQRLAEDGVLFRHAFCAAPTCSPSRAALLTGEWAHQTGMIGLAHRGARLHDYRRHILHTLRDRGYRSALCGVQHVAHGPDAPTQIIGYDESLPAGTAEERAAHASDFIRREHDRPFFLSVGFFETHRTGSKGGVAWHNGERSPLGDARYVRPPAPLPDTPDTRRDFADFIESAKRLDAAYGQILRAIDDAGLRDRTLVLCTTDHGLAYPQMKCSLTDHGMGVLLILRGPQATGLTGGKVIDAMVSHVDVYPTLCELAGAAPPAWLVGRSMMPLVRGETDRIRDELFAEVSYHAAYEPKRAIRTDRWKYIRRWDPRPGPVLPNCDDSVSKNLLIDRGWDRQTLPAEELFDLVLDPNEARNLADDPAHRATRDELRGRLDRWMRDTADPLLTGHVEPYPQMVTTPRTARSPGETPVPVTSQGW